MSAAASSVAPAVKTPGDARRTRVCATVTCPSPEVIVMVTIPGSVSAGMRKFTWFGDAKAIRAERSTPFSSRTLTVAPPSVAGQSAVVVASVAFASRVP